MLYASHGCVLYTQILTWGAFHSTKISGNSGSKSNGTERFQKFASKISVDLSRLYFFLEIWK